MYVLQSYIFHSFVLKIRLTFNLNFFFLVVTNAMFVRVQ